MEFRKYNSIENSYREKEIERLRLRGFGSEQWVATEKIHGANFSFWYDGSEVRVASRSQFVEPSGFYSCNEVVARYSHCMENLREKLSHASTLTVYGELYGPGIQKGVDYGTKKDFVAFDLVVDGLAFPPSASLDLLKEAGFRVVPVIAYYRDLTTALEAVNEFDSVLGKENGVEGVNITEGLVLLPLHVFHDTTADYSRPILKSKNSKFSEKTRVKKEKVPKAAHPLATVIASYINENRMNAVTSKMGDLTPRDFGKVIAAFSADVIEDMVKDGDLPENWKSLDDLKTVGKAVNALAVPFLKSNLLPKL